MNSANAAWGGRKGRTMKEIQAFTTPSFLQLDLDDTMEFFKNELKMDGARLDVMPCPRFPPIQDARTLQISCKVMLLEVLKRLPDLGPDFQTWFRYGGFFSNATVRVPDATVPVLLHDEFCSSRREFQTPEEAEENAAEVMIRTLEMKYDFETKDLNWFDMRRFCLDSFNSCGGMRRAKQENDALKMKVQQLTKGWRRTL